MRGDIYPWKALNEYDIDELIIKHMSIIEKREWLEVNKPNELKEFFDSEAERQFDSKNDNGTVQDGGGNDPITGEIEYKELDYKLKSLKLVTDSLFAGIEEIKYERNS